MRESSQPNLDLCACGVLAWYQGTTSEVAEKVSVYEKSLPQRLKPHRFAITYGRPEGRPLQGIRFFPQPVKAVPFKDQTFSAAPEVVP